MPKKKIDNFTWTILIILAIAIYSYYGTSRAAEPLDSMAIYDDFATGVRIDLWATAETHSASCSVSYDSCQKYIPQSISLYNRSIIMTDVPWLKCGPVCREPAIGPAVKPDYLYFTTEPNLVCMQYQPADPHCDVGYSCCGHCDSTIANMIKGHPYCKIVDNPGCTSNLYGGFATGDSGDTQVCGGYVNVREGNPAYTQIPQPTNTQYNYITVANNVLNIGASSAYYTDSCLFHRCDNGQVITSSIESTKAFTNEDIKIRYSYDAWACSGSGSCTNIPVGSISFGDDVMPITFGEARSNTNHGTGITNSGVLEIKRYDDLDTSKYAIYINGVFQRYGQNIKPATIKISGQMNIYYVRYQAYFSCQIDYDNEVVVRDTFMGGSKININSLTYVPLKFCPQDLGVLIFSPQGLTDEKGSLTERVAQGGELTVPSDQYYLFEYITKYVDDMKERCGVGEVYNTKTRQCIQIVTQQVPTTELFQCEKDADCLIPESCPGTTGVCGISKTCEYKSDTCTLQQITNYVEVLKTISLKAPEIILISRGEETTTTAGNENIAGYNFQVSGPAVREECKREVTGYVTGKGCYEVNVTWQGAGFTGSTFSNSGNLKFTIKNGDKIEISPNIIITYEMSGVGVYYGKKTKYIETCNAAGTCEKVPQEIFYKWEPIKEDDLKNSFTITFKNIFDMQVTSYEEKVKLGQTPYFKIRIKNNIFTLPLAGFNLKMTKGLRDVFLPTDKFSQPILNGWNDYSVPMIADEIGVYTGELTPFFVIKSDLSYISDKQVTFGYYVAKDENLLDCKKLGCQFGTCTAAGVCKIDQSNFIDCRQTGCTAGSCDTIKGLCVMYKTVEINTTSIQYVPSLATQAGIRKLFGESNNYSWLILIGGAAIIIIIFISASRKKKR